MDAMFRTQIFLETITARPLVITTLKIVAGTMVIAAVIRAVLVSIMTAMETKKRQRKEKLPAALQATCVATSNPVSMIQQLVCMTKVAQWGMGFATKTKI